jgi:hypothetical protein
MVFPRNIMQHLPPKKRKHYQLVQLKKAGKTPGRTNQSSATVAGLVTAVSTVSAAALAVSELTAATTKRTAAESGETNDDDAIVDSEWGRNRNNLAVAGHQEHVPKLSKT